jgi:hypothetical protein
LALSNPPPPPLMAMSVLSSGVRPSSTHVESGAV